MRVYITAHARKRIEERWPGHADPVALAKSAWTDGRLMDDRETELFFRKWQYSSFKFMPDVRVYDGFDFIFQSVADPSSGMIRLVTLFEKPERFKKRS